MNKSWCLTALVCLNLVFLTGLVMATTSPPAANAQVATGLSKNYMVVTGEVQDQYDAVYLVDMATKKLYAFTWDRGRKQLTLVSGRELRRDFRHEDD